VLDDEDREFADILRSLGMQRNTAILITYLASAGEATSREIELGASLRQPEVSIAMRDLRGKNWVGERGQDRRQRSTFIGLYSDNGHR
jgi:predicted transcriptional regulator